MKLTPDEEQLLRYFKLIDNQLHIDAALVLQDRDMSKEELTSAIISHAKHIKPIIDKVIELESKVPDQLKQCWW